MTKHRNLYKRLGDYIEPCLEKNKGLKVTLSQGICNEKYFQTPRQVALDSENDQIVRKGQFAYNKATTRNGEKISIAYRDEEDCTVSSAYQVFRIIDENLLNPYYLMMWFKRPEFDRYARFKSFGSAHEFFTWDEMCEVMLPIPNIDEQRRIVAEYQTIEKRIDNNNRLIQKLEETAQNIFLKSFPNFRDEEMKLGVLFSPHRGKNLILENCIAGNVPVIAAGKEPSAYHNQSNTDAPVITISSSGSNAGYVRLNRQKIWASDCSFIDKSQFQYIFFAYVCLKLLQEKIYSMQEGTGQPHIYPDHIKEIKICQIDNDRISEFDSKMVNIFHTIFSAQEENVKLQKVLPLLLSKLS